MQIAALKKGWRWSLTGSETQPLDYISDFGGTCGDLHQRESGSAARGTHVVLRRFDEVPLTCGTK